jgi:hypothetical protein
LRKRRISGSVGHRIANALLHQAWQEEGEVRK